MKRAEIISSIRNDLSLAIRIGEPEWQGEYGNALYFLTEGAGKHAAAARSLSQYLDLRELEVRYPEQREAIRNMRRYCA